MESVEPVVAAEENNPFVIDKWRVMESVEPVAGMEDNNLFVIDTVGETQPQEQTEHVPVKKLKRRNAAMYASTDWLILIII